MSELLARLGDYLSYPFVRYAFIVGALIALCSSLFGVTLVLKRFSFIGDGLSHVAFGALAVAGVLRLSNSMPLVLALTILAAVLLLRTGQNARLRGDAAIAMLSVGALALTALPGYKMSDVQERAEQLLKRVHMIHPEDTQAVMKLNTEAVFGMIDSLFSGVSILVWMIGLGTLLAGAIGVSNIMIVTVKERTTEIGIRRAIGATPRDVLAMVMSESIVLTLLAGMSGITLAVLILQGMEVGLGRSTPGAQFQISFGLAVGAASLLALLGVVAGLAPAMRAMKIKPVDAMREE